MNQLVNLMKKNKMTLVASLPKNDYDLAKAAWEHGADVIKLHINVTHNASKTVFGTLDQERPVLERILKDSPIPVGVVAGDDPIKAERDIPLLAKMGFDFISLYGHHAPTSMIKRNDINFMYSINHTYTIDEIKEIGRGDVADIFELSIMAPDTYGERLTARDITKYFIICQNSKIPVLMPTQHLVYPIDVPILYKSGIKAIMIGAVCMGQTVETVSSTTKAFKEAISGL